MTYVAVTLCYKQSSYIGFYRAEAMHPLSCDEHLSVCLSVSLSDWIVTKRNKPLPIFLYHMKDDAFSFLLRRTADRGCPLLPEILDQSDAPLQKRRIPIYNHFTLFTKCPFLLDHLIVKSYQPSNR